jgi:exonuclease VII small subunit
LENNSELEEVVNRFDEENEVLEDAPHPTDPSRSYIKDANKRLEAYFKRREKIAADNEQLPLWNVNDVTFIENSL